MTSLTKCKSDIYPPRKLRFPMSGEKMLSIFSYLAGCCRMHRRAVTEGYDQPKGRVERCWFQKKEVQS